MLNSKGNARNTEEPDLKYPIMLAMKKKSNPQRRNEIEAPVRNPRATVSYP